MHNKTKRKLRDSTNWWPCEENESKIVHHRGVQHIRKGKQRGRELWWWGKPFSRGPLPLHWPLWAFPLFQGNLLVAVLWITHGPAGFPLYLFSFPHVEKHYTVYILEMLSLCGTPCLLEKQMVWFFNNIVQAVIWER